MNKGLIPVVMLALVAASAIGALAHGRGHRGHEGARALLAQTLALSEDQQAELSGLRESFAEASRALRASHHEAFEDVLTTAQLATLEEIRESGTRPRVRGSLVTALGLSEEQQAALAEVREALKAERTALREEHRAAFRGVLTEQQLALLEEIKASHPRRGMGHDADGEEESNDSISTEALSTSAATAVEDQSWGQLKGAFK